MALPRWLLLFSFSGKRMMCFSSQFTNSFMALLTITALLLGATPAFGQIGDAAPIIAPNSPFDPPSGTANPASVPSHAPEIRTRVAERANEVLDDVVSIQGQVQLRELDQFLAERLDIGVLLDHRGIEIAGLNPETVSMVIDQSEQPLRTILRKTLQPLGLRAVVQDEGLVITADFAELARRGISTDKWIGIKDEVAERVNAALDTQLNLEFVDTPLVEAIVILSRETGFPIRIDRMSLEELGLTDDVPVSFYCAIAPTAKPSVFNDISADPFAPAFEAPSQSVSATPTTDPSHEPNSAPEEENASKPQSPSEPEKTFALRVILASICRPLDLTYTIRDETIVITSIEHAHSDLLSKIYFLEGTGLPVGDYSVVLDLIQASLDPENWENLGGTGTIMPVGTGTENRPAILVSTTATTHEMIQSLMRSLRDTHVGPDPIVTPKPSEEIQKPNVVTNGGMF
ncbi:hypothetical protein [Rhodopirellula sallentina]|uniref:Signal peptide protein n=1 Tax=Rhodopirellula sallentina SM41 TaxID=1263870 RepID=M5U4K0_9BACT|nr:hypothetical protein [Rhodopirellula sallentina]EMI56189.1 signal peptide protein [Rhodopirellula sallentina SM41]